MKITSYTSLFLLGCLLFSGCKNNNEQPKQVVKPVPLELKFVHDSSVSKLALWIKQQYEARRPVTKQGNPIQIKLIERSGHNVTEELASGKLKSDIWFSPSESLTEYVNSNTKNLAAKQVECMALFGSPVVAVAKPSTMKLLNVADSSYPFKTFLNNDLPSSVSLMHSAPEHSQSGLAALIQLAYTASPTSLTGTNLQSSQELTQNLGKLESFTSSYAKSTTELLLNISKSRSNANPIAITTEQEMVNYNLTHDTLTAIYPSEGSTWVNYSICKSKADWVSPELESAFNKMTQFLSTPEAKTEFLRSGFRPTLANNFEEPLTRENGVNTSKPVKLLVPPKGNIVKQLINIFQKVKKPSVNMYILDTSGSMQGEDIITVKAATQSVINKLAKEDMVALVSFSNEAVLQSGFTKDKSAVSRKINTLTAAGESALYDAITLGISNLSQGRFDTYRKNVFIITDSSDSGSRNSLYTVRDMLSNTAQQNPFNLYVLGIRRGDFNNRPINELVKASGGFYFETDRENLYQSLGLFLNR